MQRKEKGGKERGRWWRQEEWRDGMTLKGKKRGKNRG